MSLLEQIKPCDMEKPYIFISYSSEDSETVLQDVLEFQRRGYNVWLDDKNVDKTKDSWKDSALEAISNYYCRLLVFYVSRWSLTSQACYDELCQTKSRRTRAIHNAEVGYIAVETESVGNIEAYQSKVHTALMEDTSVLLDKRQKRAEILLDFIENFFLTNNEKVRVHPRDEVGRKLDYYADVTASFPDAAKIYADTRSADRKEEKPAEEKSPEVKPTEDKPAETNPPAVKPAPVQTPASAESENPSASAGHDAEYWYQLGASYFAGDGRSKNDTKAFECYQIAAELGHADAQYMLGDCYIYGYGTEEDYEKAVYWYQQAAEQSHADAQYEMGCFYFDGFVIEKFDSVSGSDIEYVIIEQDKEKAVYLFRQAALHGNRNAQYRMACLYFDGDRVEQDAEQAVFWCQLAAENHDDLAQLLLSFCCFYGIGIKKDSEKAVYWYREAYIQKPDLIEWTSFEILDAAIKNFIVNTELYIENWFRSVSVKSQ